MPADRTISDVAAELRIRREAVIALLKSGALAGFEVSAPGAKRKAYRITRAALDAFKAGRSAQQHKPSRRKTKAKQPVDFVEYF